MKDNRSTSIAVGIVVLIVGLIIGFGVARATNDSGGNSATQAANNAAQPTPATKAADLRAQLVALGAQHVQLTDTAIDTQLDNSPDASAAAAAVQQNTQALTKVIGTYYKQDTANKFQKLWSRQLTDYTNYATASAKNDSKSQAAAQADLSSFVDELSTLLSSVNPNLPQAALVKVFTTHVADQTKLIDLHVAKQYTQEFQAQAQAVNDTENTMSTLANGIVMQFPDQF